MKISAALAALLLANPVAAMTQAECDASFSAALHLVSIPVLHETDPWVTPEGACRVDNLIIETQQVLVVEIDTFEWSAKGIEHFTDKGLPPTLFRFSTMGLRTYARSGMAALDYAMRIQSQPTSMNLSAELIWDQASNAINLQDGEWHDGSGNRVTLSGRVSGLDLTDRDTIAQSAGAARVDQISSVLQFDDLFESYFAMMLIPLIVTETGDPDVQFSAFQARITDQIARVPDPLLSISSKAAATSFVDSLPHPRGALTMTLNSPGGIGTAPFVFLGMSGAAPTTEDIWSILEGTTLQVDWQE